MPLAPPSHSSRTASDPAPLSLASSVGVSSSLPSVSSSEGLSARAPSPEPAHPPASTDPGPKPAPEPEPPAPGLASGGHAAGAAIGACGSGYEVRAPEELLDAEGGAWADGGRAALTAPPAHAQGAPQAGAAPRVLPQYSFDSAPAARSPPADGGEQEFDRILGRFMYSD